MSAAAGRLARGVLSGYFLLMVLFLYAPIVVLVIFSFNDNTTPTLPLAGFTTHWYHIALGNDLLRRRGQAERRHRRAERRRSRRCSASSRRWRCRRRACSPGRP